MPRKPRKVTPHSQKRYSEEAQKYPSVAIELPDKALHHVKSAELADTTIAPQFQSAFDKLCEIPAILNGYLLGMYFERRLSRKRQQNARRRGVSRP